MSAGNSDASFAHSITDLMTSLFVVFVLLLVAYINKSYEETRKGSQSVKESLLNSLRSANISAVNDPDDPLALLVTVRDDNLQFDTAKSTLKPQGQQFLRNFIPALAKTLTDPKYSKEVESIVIEGHTDSDGEEEPNLRLSQERSFAVLKFALKDSNLSEQQKDYFLDRVSANGRGERDLVPPKSVQGQENKAESRRVEFKIRVKSFEQRFVATSGAATQKNLTEAQHK